MDTQDISLPDKCENLMINVIETRKCHGKKCMEYQQKSAQVEFAMLNIQLKSIANLKPPKLKHQIPDLPYDEMIKDMEDFKEEIINNKRRIQNLNNKIKNTEIIVTHILSDHINRDAKKPITTQALMAAAKSKGS